MGGIPIEEASRSALAQQIAQVIQANGYQSHLNVGLSGLFIDIAVAHTQFPGRYILGVELDGPSYTNAQSARDRDRLRHAVLRDHGWYLHRIWRMDWLQSPADQMQRLMQAIKEAQSDLLNQEAALQDLPVHQDLATASPSLLSKRVMDVVAVEGPVHREEIIARIRSAWNLSRSGGRIQAAVGSAIQMAIQHGDIVGDDFLHLPNLPVVPRDRSAVNFAGLRSVEMLPPTEIDASILKVVEASMGGTEEQVVQAVSRLLGFKATSSNLREVVIQQIRFLLLQEELIMRDGFICQHHPNAPQ